jgi:hypothetical protein
MAGHDLACTAGLYDRPNDAVELDEIAITAYGKTKGVSGITSVPRSGLDLGKRGRAYNAG